MNNKEIDSPIAAESPSWTALATILADAIPADKKRSGAYRVLAYLADETIRRTDGNSSAPKIPTKDIYVDLGGNPGRSASQWLSPLWDTVTQRVLPELTPFLCERCRAAGLRQYPIARKAEGNPTYYYLDTLPLPDTFEQPDREHIHKQLPHSAVLYKPDLTLKLSRRGKMLFAGDLQWTEGKRWGFLAWQLLVMLSAATITLALWGITAQSSAPLSGRDVLLLLLLGAVPWGARQYIEKSFRLFDDRIALAPDWLLAWREDGATVEIVRSKNDISPNTILVRRYTAHCPICGEIVKLDNGDPDFPRRLVGRCIESPREHVFSFDRITRSGYALRCPLIGTDGKTTGDGATARQ